jgi:hypothetical protein
MNLISRHRNAISLLGNLRKGRREKIGNKKIGGGGITFLLPSRGSTVTAPFTPAIALSDI